MREYTFVKGDGDKKIIEDRSFKKAMNKIWLDANLYK